MAIHINSVLNFNILQICLGLYKLCSLSRFPLKLNLLVQVMQKESNMKEIFPLYCRSICPNQALNQYSNIASHLSLCSICHFNSFKLILRCPVFFKILTSVH